MRVTRASAAAGGQARHPKPTPNPNQRIPSPFTGEGEGEGAAALARGVARGTPALPGTNGVPRLDSRFRGNDGEKSGMTGWEGD